MRRASAGRGRAHEGPRVIIGLCLHLSLWLLLAAVLVALQHDPLAPGYPVLAGVAIAALLALVLALWASGRTRSGALWVLSTLSILGVGTVLTEAALSSRHPDRVDASRYPYPYRMHGLAPSLRAAGNDLGVTTNDTGLREAAPVGRRRTGDFRVIVLGGSAVMGFPSADDQSAPAQLGRMLQRELERRPRPGIERSQVINAGQAWYTSTQELVFLVTELALYEPDLVIVVDGYNDLHHGLIWGDRPPANHVVVDQIRNALLQEGTFQEPGWKQAFAMMVRSSRILRRLGVGPELGLGASRAARGGLPARRNRADEEFLPLVQHRLVMNWMLMDRVVGSFGARAVFALQPTLFDKERLAEPEQFLLENLEHRDLKLRAWKALEEHVVREAGRLGIERFDAAAHLRADARPLLVDSCHLVPRGNEGLARAMLEAVLRELGGWPWPARWEGVRYPFEAGNPLWRPDGLPVAGRWE